MLLPASNFNFDFKTIDVCESEQPNEDREIFALAELSARSQTIGLWKDKNLTSPWGV